jgi:hypothetical protein
MEKNHATLLGECGMLIHSVAARVAILKSSIQTAAQTAAQWLPKTP